jgi:DNA primase
MRSEKVKLTNVQKVFFPELGKTKRDLAFAHVRELALLVKASLDERKVQSYAKTSGSRGMHMYVPIRRAPLQKEVWRVPKRIAFGLAKQRPENAWGRTLTSVYSVRPPPEASVSAPVTWEEVERVSQPVICGWTACQNVLGNTAISSKQYCRIAHGLHSRH